MDERERPSASATSRAPDGHRAIWKVIWGCPAPPKVRVFAWRVVTNSLATWANKASRHLELTDICPLCGVEREDGSHALCRRPLAIELWRVMALDWNIPEVEAIVNTGPEWIFSLLDPLDETARLVVLMTMWRVWHVRNEITHDKAPPTAEASRRFLHGYINSLMCIQQHPDGNLEKGKMVVLPSPPRAPESTALKVRAHWVPRQPGWVKLNTDRSYIAATGAAGGGMILRDDRGEIIYSACRELRTCDNALEAELEACKEGLELALHRSNLPILVELDSAEAVSMITAREMDRSSHHALIKEIRRLAGSDAREISFTLCSRLQNRISHELAAYGRSTPRTAVWLTAGMDFVVNLALAEKPP
ncbi:hypothetical protein VPH35_057369 [Triticum aestivum]